MKTDQLAGWLSELLGEPVAEVAPLTGGASRHTYRVVTGAGNALVAQIERPGGMATGIDMTTESRLVAAAAAAGVPVPVIVASSATHGPAPDGSGFTVAREIDGETRARTILSHPDLQEARDRFTAQAGRTLASIHRIDFTGVNLPEADPLDVLRVVLDTDPDPHPVLEMSLRWLRATRPDSAGRGVVHGDFRLGNLIMDPTGLVAVLDWELAHIGDPLEDLGWLCARAWRFGAPRPVAGLGERHELYAAYEDAGGAAVDSRAAHWWEVVASLRWGAICLIQAGTHRRGVQRSVELATIGRRVAEAEHDLLTLLESGS